MYLSHKYKFLFLRTPKTASSSLCEFFVQNIPDPDAIYTPIEETQNAGTLSFDILEKYADGLKYFHLTLDDLYRENVITREQINEYHNIAVLRDPLDRQKSFYYFFKTYYWWTRDKPPSLQEYKSIATTGVFDDQINSAIKQLDFLMFEGKICGEYWLYEYLDKELEKFMNKLGLEVKYPLPKYKSEFRKKYKEDFMFDLESINRMKNHFNADFNYYSKLKKEKYESYESIHS